ncbi:MAG: hypothetical protein JW934_22205, partial [Anaerolineae bacterium]|nr:hypothetical protein [Anaerolineae bacterium]
MQLLIDLFQIGHALESFKKDRGNNGRDQDGIHRRKKHGDRFDACSADPGKKQVQAAGQDNRQGYGRADKEPGIHILDGLVKAAK